MAKMINAAEIGILLLVIVIYIVFRLRQRGAAKTRVARLVRIKNASFIFSALMWVGIPLSAYWFLGFLFGWPGPGHDRLRIVIAHQVYASPSEMPPEIFWLMVVKQGLGFFAAAVLLRLFWLYGHGILFSAKNVNCIRFFGYFLIIDWFIDNQMQGFLHDMDLSTGPIFIGLLIIFVAWIMDEGRKIQEDQELTV